MLKVTITNTENDSVFECSGEALLLALIEEDDGEFLSCSTIVDSINPDISKEDLKLATVELITSI